MLLSPLLAVTALAIRLESPGPILFRQPRHGYNHRPVEVWKFRSMYVGDCDPAARRIVTRDDPRVTRVGRVIRRLSIDELPQLFNVLKGELSLVGPAAACTECHLEPAGVRSRRSSTATPPATRFARASPAGRRSTAGAARSTIPTRLRRRVEHDLFYIENWSLWLDLRILALTPFRLLDTRNAY